MWGRGNTGAQSKLILSVVFTYNVRDVSTTELLYRYSESFPTCKALVVSVSGEVRLGKSGRHCSCRTWVQE
ncbi:hypothetical protein XELAEV_18018937mg [Xenopus laevis]|uniref:Uncharacterized protein n=1 Tax=Xenopus laevis TaxID=8355 RepID=A0A974DF43_XENLA|nr:hypothetical protein XELAEV_18018937mg [Xenopus laevis]